MKYLQCLTDKTHIIAVNVTSDGLKKLIKKRKCPTCNTPSNMAECHLASEDTAIAKCEDGHETVIGAFTNGVIYTRWDSGYCNYDGEPDEVESLLQKEIVCKHDGCGKSIAIFWGSVSKPGVNFVKTRVRVGDVWDKNRVPAPVKGHYAGGEYHETEYDKVSKRRIKDMQGGKIEVFNEKTKKQEMKDRKK